VKQLKQFFYYNWQVREDWFEWAKQVSAEDLLKQRVGGFNNILHTLLHIVVVEFDWINDLLGGEVIEFQLEDYQTMDDVINLHQHWHPMIRNFVENWTDNLSDKQLVIEGGKRVFSYGEVMKHVIVHEIHHIGQLSIWARELGLSPVQANYIGRGLS
jgi:uncharacterized damage-inducible protein DinB